MGILSMDGIDLHEAPKGAIPLCPHCDKELKELWYKSEGVGGIGEKQVLMCPYCQTLLGYGLWRS